MAQKDTSEKILESYNDVFSDIVNVLLFNGKQVLSADELELSLIHISEPTRPLVGSEMCIRDSHAPTTRQMAGFVRLSEMLPNAGRTEISV